MKRLPILLLFTALLPTLAWPQAPSPGATLSRAQAERNAVELKQGMTPDEVQQLLGKPRRTALRGNGGSASAASQGSLQWTYVWSGPASSSSSERSLNIDFAAKAADQWSVNGWGWTNY